MKNNIKIFESALYDACTIVSGYAECYKSCSEQAKCTKDDCIPCWYNYFLNEAKGELK